jgi:hypothetical protein
MVILFGWLRHAVTFLSSTRTKPSATASWSALRTVCGQQPASAAIWPMVNVLAP